MIVPVGGGGAEIWADKGTRLQLKLTQDTRHTRTVYALTRPITLLYNPH